MATYKAQVSFFMDTGLPKDVVTITPHYISQGDPQALTDQLKSNIISHVSGGATNWFTIKAYDVRAPKPSYPVAISSNVVAARASSTAREVALCLSFYGTHNRPNERGRLYLPYIVWGGTIQLRPSTAQQQAVMDFATQVLTVAPGIGQWAVWSPTRQTEHVVEHWWCDDEWDTVRSRGLKPTTRLSA